MINICFLKYSLSSSCNFSSDSCIFFDCLWSCFSFIFDMDKYANFDSVWSVGIFLLRFVFLSDLLNHRILIILNCHKTFAFLAFLLNFNNNVNIVLWSIQQKLIDHIILNYYFTILSKLRSRVGEFLSQPNYFKPPSEGKQGLGRSNIVNTFKCILKICVYQNNSKS